MKTLSFKLSKPVDVRRNGSSAEIESAEDESSAESESAEDGSSAEHESTEDASDESPEGLSSEISAGSKSSVKASPVETINSNESIFESIFNIYRQFIKLIYNK